jgi:tetratricopeptide (TPR) repeat protein
MPKADRFLKASYSGPLLVLLIVILLVPAGLFCQDEESLGRLAEQAGKLREALTRYVAALQSTTEGTDQEQQLREKIIALARQIKPAPLVPDEALTHFGRGRAAGEIAKNPEDFQKAIDEFRQALRLAPWLANAYLNLGVVEDKAGQYADAIRQLKLYLLAAPSASDADDVKTRIAGAQYKLEQKQAEDRAARDKRQAEARAAAAVDEAESLRRQAEEQKSRDILASLEGLWLNGRTRMFEYRLTRVEDNDYQMLMVRSRALGTWDSVPSDSAFGRLSRRHILLSGSRISGTADVANCGGKGYIAVPITGEVLDHGQRMVIRWVSPHSCSYKGVVSQRANEEQTEEYERE